MTPTRISDEGIALVKRWEGFRADAYEDVAGVWTIGYGHTTGVRKGMTIPEAEAALFLRRDLRVAEAAVRDAVTVPLTQAQFDALVSLVFNIGANAFRRSTLLRLLNRERYHDVPQQFLRWNRAGGRVVDGLANRRAAEAGLWSRGTFVASRDVRPSAPSTLGSDTVRGAGAVGLAGLAGIAAEAAPAASVLGSLPTWTAVALIAATLIGVLVWRWRRG